MPVKSAPYQLGLKTSRLWQACLRGGSILMIGAVSGCSDEPAAVPVTAKTDAPSTAASSAPDVLPPLAIDLLPKTSKQSTGIDYIIDGSASMCGYFNAKLNTTEHTLPITQLLQAIQAVRRSEDRVLVFMQDEAADKAHYVPFETFENQLMQGGCDLKGQYTELGLILRDYTGAEDAALQPRSLMIVSDMHFLPTERSNFEAAYDALLGTFMAADSPNLNLANGIWTVRAPFLGTYYTVNNATTELEQTQKQLHLFWFTKDKADAEQIQKIQQNLITAQAEYPSSVVAQAEFLPQLRLLTDDAKTYAAFSAPAPLVNPKDIIDLSAADKAQTPPRPSAYISAFDPSAIKLSSEQQACHTLSWGKQNNIVFYPYPNPEVNRDAICPDGPLFRAKTGSTLRLNLPLKEGYSVTATAPKALQVVEGYLSVPIVDHKEHCIGVSAAEQNATEPQAEFSIQYTAASLPIDTRYYAQYSIERDGCTAQTDCTNLVDKTFQYNQLISSLANKSKQHIDKLYPRTMTVSLTCDPS